MTEWQVTSEMTESSKDHEWMLKSLGERVLKNRIFAWCQNVNPPTPTSESSADSEGENTSLQRRALAVTTIAKSSNSASLRVDQPHRMCFLM